MSIPTAAQFSDFINALIGVENQARDLGLFETMHAINAAKNKAGYEREHQLIKFAKEQK